VDNKNYGYPLPLKISGLGCCLPERVVPSSDLEKECNLPPDWCQKKQGIKERRWFNPDEYDTISYAKIGAAAAKQAVDTAGITLSEIDLLVHASSVYDQVVPDQSVQLLRELGLGQSGISCMSINGACLSFMAALDVSSGLIATGLYHNILIVSEIITSHSRHRDNPLVYTILGDGAAAVVVTRTPEGEPSKIHAALMETYSTASDVSRFLNDEKYHTAFTKDLNSEDFDFDFNPQSMQKAGIHYNQGFIDRLWTGDRNSFKLIIPNQATRLPIDMMKLRYPADRIIGIIDRFGNLGAVGYMLALSEAVQTKRVQRGDLILLHGMGPGFSIMGMVLTY
jgi:3-oxoacyl-[acyl-carrier-protein] synthase-3